MKKKLAKTTPLSASISRAVTEHTRPLSSAKAKKLTRSGQQFSQYQSTAEMPGSIQPIKKQLTDGERAEAQKQAVILRACLTWLKQHGLARKVLAISDDGKPVSVKWVFYLDEWSQEMDLL